MSFDDCRSGEHDLKVIFSVNHPWDCLSVVEWCRLCGAWTSYKKEQGVENEIEKRFEITDLMGALP